MQQTENPGEKNIVRHTSDFYLKVAHDKNALVSPVMSLLMKLSMWLNALQY